MRIPVIVALFAMLLVPAGALGQSSLERIVILDNMGEYQRGQGLFVFGTVATVAPDVFLIMKITNPRGDLCQIQQITPLSSGVFLTDPIPLSGAVCGVHGDYDLQLFYGDYTRSSTFSVSGTFSPPGGAQLFEAAGSLVSAKIVAIEEASSRPLDMTAYTGRLGSAGTLQDLEGLYADLWGHFLLEGAIFEVDPVFRPAASAALDASAELLESGEISPEISKGIDRLAYSAMFHHGIGNTNRAVALINDAFAQVKNVNPVKAQPPKLSFSEMEDTLLNIMIKTDSVMSSAVQEEVAFILARGTAPLFSGEMSGLVDMLSKSRYLDVVSRKDSPMYRLVNSEWEGLRGSMQSEGTVAELLEFAPRVEDLHGAALLLRQMDRVDRFVSSEEDENSDLANIIKPEWDSLVSRLGSASSAQDILDRESDIEEMASVIEISSRLVKSVEIARGAGVAPGYVNEWRALLADVDEASTVGDILEIVSAFDASITELREKRNPLVSLKFEYDLLKQKAEIQADHASLAMINQALRIIESAREGGGQQTSSRIDRSEVLLTWASQAAPAIRADLEESSVEASHAKAEDILQRAKSIENLAELSMTKNRFLPGFTDFTDSIHERLDEVRSLVIGQDLVAADAMVRELFAEWRTVSGAYADDPDGSGTGYSLDELQRIQYREQLEEYAGMVSTFYNSGWDEHEPEYARMVGDAYDQIEYGNFIDAESEIRSIGQYLSDNLPLKNPGIIYDISYDQERDIWTLQGAVDKRDADEREDLYVAIYDMDGNRHSFLEFTDTRAGDFFTKWEAPTDPGLYVVMLEYRDAKASQIAHIVDETVREPRAAEYGSVEAARRFEDLKKFMDRFGGGRQDSNPRFAPVIQEIRADLADRKVAEAEESLDYLEHLIERYLPVRSRAAVIDAQYDGTGNTLVISGAVQKLLVFGEDLFVDVYDQGGDLVKSVSLKDDGIDGVFGESVSVKLEPGMHVALLEYHDLTVTDFFLVPSP